MKVITVCCKRYWFLITFVVGFWVFSLMLGYVVRHIFKSVLYQPGSEIYRTPKYYDWEYEDVFLPVNSYITHGWFIPIENARGCVLFSHGNAGNIADRLESVGIFRKLGLSVLVYDYGGYGRSTGKSMESRCYEDGMAMWKWLVDNKKINPSRIILFGRSLGGAVTAELATRVECGGVILESTFLSTYDVARDIFPWVPKWIAKGNEFNTKEKLYRIKAPVLVVHSPEDRLIKFYHGKKIFELLQTEKEFLQIKGDHNDGFVISGDLYIRGLERFILRVLNSNS